MSAASGASRSLYSGRLSPSDKMFVAYLGLVALLSVIAHNQARLWWVIVPLHALVITGILVAAKWSASTESFTGLAARAIRFWYVAPLIPAVYKELQYLVPAIHPHDLDWQLAAIDYRLFGVNPTVWLERISFPLLTELLQYAYITYYVLPIILGIILWRKHRFSDLHFLLFVIVTGFLVSYIGYMLVPALGPRFILDGQQSEPLRGVFLFSHIRHILDSAEGQTRDCFPSGHTEMAVLVMCCAWRLIRSSLVWLAPIASALIFSTVYLRYHYVIDVIAGALLAALIMTLADRMYVSLGGEQVEAFPPEKHGLSPAT